MSSLVEKELILAPYRPLSVHFFTEWNIFSLYHLPNDIKWNNNELNQFVELTYACYTNQDNSEIIHTRDVLFSDALVYRDTKNSESGNIYRKLISVYAIVNSFTKCVVMKE